ncbi:hypothetical protein [Streptomyces sp. NPDC015350]|uniref:hypothetical protein n=1 Tax=Streptomyces sp. NPDC015350 TaxID=3364955 RepID=UPI0036F607C2
MNERPQDTGTGAGHPVAGGTGDPAGSPATGSAGGPERPVLDELVPRWDRGERHRLRVDAPAAAVIDAADGLTWGEVPSFRLVMLLAGLGRTPFPKDGRVLDMFLDNGFRMLHRSESQLVIGGIQRISRKQPIVPMGDDPAKEFRDFEAPAHILTSFDFRFSDGVLTTETRVRCTDRRARRLFAAYWLLIRAGSGGIRHVWLRGVRRRVRARAAEAG